MTREEKILLLKELCARLPYSVKVHYTPSDYHYPISEIWTIKGINDLYTINIHEVSGSQVFYKAKIEDIKPYLRPLSSMTDEEEREYNGTLKPLGDFMFEQEEEFKPIQLYKNIPFELYEFFNSHHFDYRGLIEKGLALEASDGMYKTE